MRTSCWMLSEYRMTLTRLRHQKLVRPDGGETKSITREKECIRPQDRNVGATTRSALDVFQPHNKESTVEPLTQTSRATHRY